MTLADQMNQDFSSLSLNELQELYNKATAELEQSLLDGTGWNEVRDKRMVVTRLARELWRKREALFTTQANTPADSQLRAE